MEQKRMKLLESKLRKMIREEMLKEDRVTLWNDIRDVLSARAGSQHQVRSF